MMMMMVLHPIRRWVTTIPTVTTTHNNPPKVSPSSNPSKKNTNEKPAPFSPSHCKPKRASFKSFKRPASTMLPYRPCLFITLHSARTAITNSIPSIIPSPPLPSPPLPPSASLWAQKLPKSPTWGKTRIDEKRRTVRVRYGTAG